MKKPTTAIPWVEQLLRDCMPTRPDTTSAVASNRIRRWVAEHGMEHGIYAGGPESDSRASPPLPTPLLYEHEDGRFGLSFGPTQFAIGNPAWHRMPPADVFETPRRQPSQESDYAMHR